MNIPMVKVTAVCAATTMLLLLHPRLLLLLLIVAAYWAPTIIAALRRSPDTAAIAVVNMLLGWTFVGWVIALALAVSPVAKPVRWIPIVMQLPQPPQQRGDPVATPAAETLLAPPAAPVAPPTMPAEPGRPNRDHPLTGGACTG